MIIIRNYYFTNIDNRIKLYSPPLDGALKLVLDDDRPLKIINAPENISAAIIRLQAFENRFLYVVKYLDKEYFKIFN